MVVVRCDGSAALGMGHVSRCLALAEEVRDAHRVDVVFAMRDPDSIGVAAVRAKGYQVDCAPHDTDDERGAWLHACVASRRARALVVDVRDRLARTALESVRAAGTLVATIDDGSERRLAADLAFYPPVPQVEEMDWRGFTGRRFAGWEWVILRREFAPGGEEPPAIDVLVTMGASDPAGFTEFALGALSVLPVPLAVTVVVGPGFSRDVELTAVTRQSVHAVQVLRPPASIAPIMRASRIAVVSFGVSAYELAACGVPAVHLYLTEDHARSGSVFQREGIALTAGLAGRAVPAELAEAAGRLLGDAELRASMAARARRLVDGRGARRVADVIVAAL